MNYTESFLQDINSIDIDILPDKVIKKAKMSLLDYIGVTLAGAKLQQSQITAYLDASGCERGDLNVIGLENKLNIKDAIFVNGFNSHALDFDDGTNAGIIHLGSPIFSALLPLAQKYGIDGESLLKAAVIGYETSFTMAMSVQPVHKEQGYHATGTCGTLGVAMAVAHLMHYTPNEQKYALSAAAVSASGALKVLEDGSKLKPYNVAKTALMGFIAASVGKAGWEDPYDALGGRRGFLNMMMGNCDNFELHTTMLNGTYAIEKTYIKPYAACRYCHPSIEAALNIRNRHGIKSDDIKAIHIKTYYWAVNKHDHVDIKGSGSAKMSIPYSVAVALYTGKAGMTEYDESYIENSDILSLTKKIIVESDNELTEIFPEMTVAALELFTNDGRQIVERVDYPKGEPENPMTESELYNKFTELAIYGGKTIEQAEKIIKTVMDIESSLGDLFELL